jgi:hypothetical protein
VGDSCGGFEENQRVAVIVESGRNSDDFEEN